MNLGAAVRSRSDLLRAIEEADDRPVERLGQTLIGLGLITEADLASALAAQRQRQDQPIGAVLVQQGRVSSDQLETALNLKLGFAVVDLEHFDPEPAALAKVPWALVERTHALPLMLQEGQLIVAMADPKRQDLVDELSWASGCWVRPVLADSAALRRRIGSGHAGGRMGLGASGRLDALAAAITPPTISEGEAFPEPEADAVAPVEESDLVRLLNRLLIEADALGASDIHIEAQPGREPVRVRLRLDGALKTHLELPASVRATLVARIKVMARLDTSERRRPQDGRIRLAAEAGRSPIDLRVATVPTREGLEDVVMRLMRPGQALPLEALDFQAPALARLREAVRQPHGLILCAGPTGSGKTTTLHAALAALNTADRKIWTAEDPIEIVQPGLCQVQVQPRLDWTFERALRAFLRADPDVIMVGEIRDRETAQVAAQAALTGHLVLSTIHTNSAAETVARLLDMGIDPFLVADSLRAVVGQRLVRRLCPHCRSSRSATEAELQTWLRLSGQAHEPLLQEWRRQHGVNGALPRFESVGCPRCGGTGRLGRVGLHEVMAPDRELRRLIQRRAPSEDIQACAQRGGMATLVQDGLEKMLMGLISLEDLVAALG